jgi:hypothetical protein
VATALGGAVTLARLFRDGILARWLQAILLERDTEIIKGSAAQKFIDIPLCCYQLVVECTRLTDTTDATTKWAQIAAILAFEEVIDLPKGDLGGCARQGVSTARSRGAVDEIGLRKRGKNLGHHGSRQAAFIRDFKGGQTSLPLIPDFRQPAHGANGSLGLLSIHNFRPFVVEFGFVAPIYLGLTAIYYGIKDILFRDSATGITPVNPRILRGNITTSRSVIQ